MTSIDFLKVEIDIYGVSDNWCVVGVTSLRAGTKLLDELFKKYRLPNEKYPNLLKG